MSAALALLRIETRRTVALLLSPLILAAAWWLAWYGTYGVMSEALFEGVYLWEETSRVVKDSVLNVGPLLAGLCAWVAGRNRRRGMGDLLSTTARPAFLRELATWAGAALPFVAAYMILALLLGVPTTLNATWGAPLPGYLLVGLVALLMDSALGFAAGYLLPSRFTAPLVAVALYVAHLLPMGAGTPGSVLNLTLLYPAAYSNYIGADVFHEPQRLAVQQILLFGGLGATALALVALKGRGAGKTARRMLAASVAISVVGLVAALATQDSLNPGPGKAKAVPFDPVCDEGALTVCVHPAYEKLLPKTARAVNEVAEPLVGLSGAPTHGVQANGLDTLPAGFEAEDVVTFSGTANLSTYDVAAGLVADQETMYGAPEGEEGMPEPTTEDLQRCGEVRREEYFDPAWAARTVVEGWLLMRVEDYQPEGYGPESDGTCPNGSKLLDEFAALPDSEREAWLRENLAGLRAGEVTLRDLP